MPRLIGRRPVAVLAIASAVLSLAMTCCWVYSLFASFGQAWADAGGRLGDGYQTRVWVVEGGSLQLLSPLHPKSSARAQAGSKIKLPNKSRLRTGTPNLTPVFNIGSLYGVFDQTVNQ